MNRSDGYAYEEAKKNAFFQQLHVAALVQVIASYPKERAVDVKPLVKSLREGSYISQPPILRVPVMQLGSAAFPVRPVYEAGDCGLVVYLDQYSDNVLLSGAETEPQTENYHSAAYPVFCGLVQADAGAETYLEVSREGVTVHGKVNIKGELIVNGASIGGGET